MALQVVHHSQFPLLALIAKSHAQILRRAGHSWRGANLPTVIRLFLGRRADQNIGAIEFDGTVANPLDQ